MIETSDPFGASASSARVTFEATSMRESAASTADKNASKQNPAIVTLTAHSLFDRNVTGRKPAS
jgi:hypothetical protein